MIARRRGLTCCVVVLVMAVLGGGNSSALTDEEIFRDFRFNFISPGARALGLGGAFIAAADDATAAEANPAALHYINKIELFAEYRVLRPVSQVIVPTEEISGVSTFETLDFSTINNRQDDEVATFVSVALPFNIGRKRATLAFSRQVVLASETTLTDRTRSLETSLNFGLDTFPVFVNPQTGQVEQYTISNTSTGLLDTSIVHYNFGFSLSLTGDLSIGATTTLAQLDVSSNVLSQSRDPRGILNSINPRVDRDGDGLVEDIQTLSVIDDDDSAFSYALGLHWHPDSLFQSGISPVRVGAVYRKGATLEVEQSLAEFDETAGEFGAPEVFVNTFRVPDRYGLGFSYELGRNWVFAVDLERIEYGDLLENFESGRNFFTSGLVPASELDLDPGTEIRFDVDDATVYHAGVEYNWITTGKVNYAVRVGTFNAPDNRIRMTQFNSNNGDVNDVFLDLFRGGEDDEHFTVGFSIITSAGLQFQAAGDFADSGDEFLVSAIYRFGRVRR